MSNIISAGKRHRQNIARRARNKAAMSMVRTATRKYKSTLEQKDTEAAAEQLKQVIKLIDTYTNKGLFHKNTAARKKSRLTALLHKSA
ncbi:MAG: 30S ribosomal protein S20 [Spirochaetota bacterium]